MNNQAQMWIASGEFEVDDHAYWHADQSDKDNTSSDEDNNKQEEKKYKTNTNLLQTA